MTLLRLVINRNLYQKDPQETELGRKILQESITLIDEIGIESFTFRKLAMRIDSTEASVYRYFENKHRLLVYLIAWYWNWLEYQIDFHTQNISDPHMRLEIALNLVTREKTSDPSFPQIDEPALARIVIAESDKTYLTKQVDDENKEGLFRGFKSICGKIAGIISEINPEFRYPHSLVSTVLQAANQQLFFARHLPSLSDMSGMKGDLHKHNEEFLKSLIFKSITH